MRRPLPGRLPFLFLTGLAFTLLPSALQAQNVEKVTFDSFDKVELQGDWYPSPKDKKAPTALLVHKIGGDRTQLRPIAARLQEEGYAVLNFDLRGHGDSTGINPVDFWSVRANQSGFTGGFNPKKASIDVKEFKASYYPFLINDLAAAKYFLEKKNNAGECNVKDLVIVAAEDGATLAALWHYTEWDRRRLVAGPMGFPTWGEPEGKDMAAIVFLSLRSTLGSGNKVVSVRARLADAFLGTALRQLNARQMLRERVGYCFFFGSEDGTAKEVADSIYDQKLQADKNKLRFTYKVPLETKLAGHKLLSDPMLEIEARIVKYLNVRVFAVRNATVWEERDLKAYPLIEVPLKQYGILVPGS